MRKNIFFFIISALIPLACSGGNARLNHVSETILRQHKRVAVVDVKIDIREEGLLKDAFDLAANQVKGQPFSANSERQAQLEEHAINAINRNLLDKGFMPVQRSRIKSILNEQRFQQSGLTEDSSRIGALLKADAVFHGTIVVKRSSGLDVPFIVACLFPPLFLLRKGDAQLLFSGNMTSVESGYIVLSGTNAEKAGSFSLEDIDSLINNWFDKMPAVQ